MDLPDVSAMTAAAAGAWTPGIAVGPARAPCALQHRGHGRAAGAWVPRAQHARAGAIVIPDQAGMRENAARFPRPTPPRGGVPVLSQLRVIARPPPRHPPRRLIACPDQSDEHLPLPPDSTVSQTTRRRFAATRTAVAVEEPIA